MEAIRRTKQASRGSNLERGQIGRAVLKPSAVRSLPVGLNAREVNYAKTWKGLRWHAGFTLLEIVIAIAILAIVFSSLYAAYSNTLETTELVESERDVEQAARLGLMRMADDLASLYVQESEDDSAASPYRFVSGSTDSLDEGGTVVEFATSGNLDFDMIFPSLRINRVSYVLEKQVDNEDYYRLVRRELPFAGLVGEEHVAEIEVADGVEQLTLTYVDEEGQVQPQWDSKAEETKGLPPRLVLIRLQLAGDKSRIFTTTVAIPPVGNKQ